VIGKIKPHTSDLSDHETFRQSIAELDQILKSTWRSTVLRIAAALAAIIAVFVVGNIALNHQFEMTAVVEVFLASMIVFYGCDLLRHGRTKSVRDRLAMQMQVAIKQRILADKLYGLSIMDPLTGLHNRRFGEERLNDEILRAERTAEPLAVLLFDLDYFKEINDQFGHAAGDSALQSFSRALRKAIRACDVPVRIGGDEFLVILPDCPREKVDAIVARIGSPQLQFGNEVIPIGYSVGRAHYQSCDTPQAMLERADRGVYREKAARRDGENGQLGSHQKKFVLETMPSTPSELFFSELDHQSSISKPL
jgi:diguanylate cyclase (GGDEF)-like protein